MRKLMILPALLLLAGNVFAGGASEKPAAPAAASKIELFSADVTEVSVIRVRAGGLPTDLTQVKFAVEPGTPAAKVERSGIYLTVTTDAPMQKGVDYTLKATVGDQTASTKVNTGFLAEAAFNALYSDKPLGYFFEGGKSIFRVFIPRGKAVETVIFNKLDDSVEAARIVPMTNDGNQVFEAVVDGPLWGKYYGYRITERENVFKPFTPTVPSDTVFADPYAKAIAQTNTFPQKNRGVIIDTSKYNWEGVQPVNINISDAVIMEAHIRDLTANPTAGTTTPGYKGMINATNGGIKYLKDLGINAVEFLPLQEFGDIEPPYQVSAAGLKNTWNVYGRNYWGYMTSNYFAPESYYASDATTDPTKWNGSDGRAVNEFKDMVKAMHKEGIAVIMDVVYNHTAGYDENTFKIIDTDYYFKKNDKTGTGNEMESRRLMVRRMILDSLRHWMTEYRVDGFRFDLATSHDKETVKAIADLVYSINPKAMLIAEPWGGEGATNAKDFLNAGWAKWNDGIRSAIRSENRPTRTGQAFALGNGGGADNLKAYWMGSVDGAKPWQMVNYIESHDDTTFGDNMRIQSGFYNFFQADGKTPNRITDIPGYLKLNDYLLGVNKVGAVALFLAQGPIMLHIGQEWARGKITPDLTGKVQELTTKGRIGSSSDNVVFLTPSPNTYSADNEVNWINFEHAKLNQSLIDFYKGLIRLRIAQPLLGGADPKDITILENAAVPNAMGTNISGKIYGFVNADTAKAASFTIPAGTYDVMLDKNTASPTPLRQTQGGTVEVAPQSGLILIKK